MKKFLLSLVVACIAITMNAQRLTTPLQDLTLAKQVKFAPTMKLQAPSNFKASIKDFSKIKASMKKAPAQSDLYGEYVMDAAEDIHTCTAAELSNYEYTDDATGETTTYVEVSLYGGYADVLGLYDAEAGTLTIPDQQVCYEVTEDDSNLYSSLGECQFILCNCSYDNGKPSELLQKDIVFEVDDDGNLYQQSDGLFIYIYGGDYDGYYYAADYNISLFPVNASQTETLSGNDYTFSAYVEDYTTNIGLYDCFGMGGYAEMNIDDDLKVSLDLEQPIFATTSSYVSQGYSDYFYLYLYFQNPDDGQWYFSMNDPITGVLEGNTITFDDGCALIATKENEDGTVSGTGYAFTAYSLTLNDKNFLAGIQEVKGTREDQIKNTKTYNLMGQQVNRDSAKGLLIYGGKKYIKK